MTHIPEWLEHWRRARDYARLVAVQRYRRVVK